jgi:hypothetical protein
VNCLGSGPLTLDDWLASVDRCATLAGGPQWAETARLGAVTLLFLALAVVGLAGLARAARG